MEKNNIFNPTVGQIRSTFGLTPEVKPSTTQNAAIATASQHFIAIGTVLAEGKVSPEYAEAVLEKLYETKLLLNQAVLMGWDNGFGVKGQA
jgi:hypothetical protein